METFLFFVLLFTFSGLFRWALNFPIFRPKNQDTLYKSTWVTGYPGYSRGFFIGATNCLWVHVTDEAVEIRPHFPLCLFLIPELLGIGWSFTKEQIIDCNKTLMGVQVRYQGRFCEREFVVYVGDKDAFIKAISS